MTQQLILLLSLYAQVYRVHHLFIESNVFIGSVGVLLPNLHKPKPKKDSRKSHSGSSSSDGSDSENEVVRRKVQRRFTKVNDFRRRSTLRKESK